MRLGLLLYGLDGAFGGIGRYSVELARAMSRAKNGDSLTLLTTGKGPELSKVGGSRQVRLPGCRLLPGLVTIGNLAIPVVSRSERLNVVHDPTGVSPFVLGAAGAKTVVTIHDTFPRAYPGTSTFLDTLIHRHWLPRVLPKADAVITVSESSKRDIVRYLKVNAEKVHVTSEGVDPIYRPVPPAVVSEVRVRYGLPESYLLFVGSVERRKNLRRLLLACARLWRKGERRPLVVVGARRLQPAALLGADDLRGIEGRVIFTGYVPETDLPALYAGADLFVFPSLYEGFGLPPLEAMACGTPVVCSSTSSLPEVVGDAAVTVDPRDVTGLADAIRQVVTSPGLREELSQKGIARAHRFTWEQTARQTLEVYRQVCN